MANADDLLDKAGGFFSKLGSTLKQTTKQVTGIGRGNVRLELARTKVAPGDTLAGKLTLALPEAIAGKRLVVTLRAQQRTVEFQRRDGVRTPVSSRTTIFHFDRELGGAQQYDSRTIDFELVVPPDALDKQAPAGQPSDRGRGAIGRVGPDAASWAGRVERDRAVRNFVGQGSHTRRRHRRRALSRARGTTNATKAAAARGGTGRGGHRPAVLRCSQSALDGNGRAVGAGYAGAASGAATIAGIAVDTATATARRGEGRFAYAYAYGGS